MKKADRTNRAIVWSLAAIISAVMSFAVRSSAATLYVSQTSPEPSPPYSTPETAAHNIQDAVDVANDGDTVLVEPGDYGVTNTITVTHAVRLQSTGGASQTFLTAYGSVCLSISNALAVADGFSLRVGTGDPRGANLFGGTIQNCNFTNFYAYFGSIVMSGGTVSNVIVWYYRGHAGGAAVSCSDSGLITDSQILGKAPVGSGASAVALVNSRLQNSVITGTGGSPHTSGVAVSAVSSTIVGCTISGNYNLGQGGGAYLQDSLMDRCIVTGNTSGGDDPGSGGGGIFETNSVIRNSLIVNNGVVIGDGGAIYGGYGGGVHMQGGALLDCTVSGNTTVNFADLPGAGAGIYVEGNGAVTNSIIYFNSFSGASASSSNFNAGPGIFDHCCTAPDPGGSGNITQDPQFVDMTNGNFHLASTSPCVDAGVVQAWMTGAQALDGNPRTKGGKVDMGAYESPPVTHYVSQTSPSPTPPYSTLETAAHTIQEAVDAASDGDIVLVEAGDYVLTNQVTVTKAIYLQSASGPSQTFLTAQKIYGIDMWCLRMSNSLAVADGLSFRSQGPSGESAFGAFVAGGTIQNCTFSNLYVGNPGGAIVMSGGGVSNTIVTYRCGPQGAAVYGSAGTLITDSQILGINSGGGGFGSAVSLTNSRLQNSVISGVSLRGNVSGVAVSALSSSVVGCTISNNFSLGNGGGAYLQDSLMDRCIVTGNVAGGEKLGGGGVFETNSIVRNSLIFSNHVTLNSGDPSHGPLGGGVFMQGGALVNCTVAGNGSWVISNGTGGGGGVFADGGGITNCIIYLNSNIGAASSSSNWLNSGAAIFDHCCTAPEPGGAGDITRDPQFVDMSSGNFHLASTSPCIGAGIFQSWMTGAQDLDGKPRAINGRVDMGAYQNQSLPSVLSITRSGSNIVLRWPSAGTAGLILENSPSLTAAASWTPTAGTVNDDGTNKSVTLPATSNAQFFRLR
jgi:hypothetical protein